MPISRISCSVLATILSVSVGHLLGNLIEKDRSPQSPTVLPASDKQARIPARDKTELKYSKPVVGKHEVSWAEIASG
jgi:hypothetical protein